MRGTHTEYNGNAHTRDGSVYGHTWWYKGRPFYYCCCVYSVYCEILKVLPQWCVRILRGNRGNLHGTDVTCHLIYKVNCSWSTTWILKSWSTQIFWSKWYTFRDHSAFWKLQLSGRFKSQQCQQLLTGPPKNIVCRAPPNRKQKSCKQVGQSHSYFFPFTFWNHWNLFWAYQNGNFTPLKGPP